MTALSMLRRLLNLVVPDLALDETGMLMWAKAAHRDGRVLVVMVPYMAPFGVMAIETVGGVSSVQAVFDHHAHKVVVDACASFDAAVMLAREYATRWSSGEAFALPACDCPEITPKHPGDAGSDLHVALRCSVGSPSQPVDEFDEFADDTAARITRIRDALALGGMNSADVARDFERVLVDLARGAAWAS